MYPEFNWHDKYLIRRIFFFPWCGLSYIDTKELETFFFFGGVRLISSFIFSYVNSLHQCVKMYLTAKILA